MNPDAILLLLTWFLALLHERGARAYIESRRL
jgi:hypothetical protein